MTSQYATADQLAARLSPAYSIPAHADILLQKASEAVDFACQGRAEVIWTNPTLNGQSTAAAQADVTKATCDQVEYWLEEGEEEDVLGLHGSLQGGRVQVNHLPGYLGQRAMRTLVHAGLYWAGAGAV